MKEFIDAVVAAFRSLLETVFTQVEQNTSTIAAQQETLQEHGAIIVDLAERVAKLEQGAPPVQAVTVAIVRTEPDAPIYAGEILPLWAQVWYNTSQVKEVVWFISSEADDYSTSLEPYAFAPVVEAGPFYVRADVTLVNGEKYAAVADFVAVARPIDPIDPDPVDPPADDITVEIVSRGSLTPGAQGLFEAVVSDYSDVATVDFFLNGQKVHTERVHKYEYEPTIPSTEFEMSVQVNFNNGKAQIAGSKVFVPVSAPPVGGGGGGDPTPTPGTGIEEYDALVAAADETWYDFNAASSGLSDGFVSETAIKGQFNASDAFMGLKYNNTRYKFESQVPEMGNIPGLLLFTPPGANNANYQERVSIPKTKDVDYTPGREVAVAMDFFFLSAANKTGNVDVDIRTYNTEPHVKRNGLQSFENRPNSGSNPVPNGGGCEFVLMSQYDAETFINNFPYGNKGDQYGLELPQGETIFDMQGIYEGPFDVNSPAYTRDRMILACGIYGHDVTDYDFQSQAFACYPGTNIRMTFAPDTLYEMRWTVGMNTVSNGVSNQDGYFRWWIRNENVNGGEWFLACQLNNRDWTGNVPMLLANLGNGCYYGGNGKGYYLNDGATANGLWFTKSSAHVKI